MSGKTTIVNEYGVSADVNSSNELKVALSSDVQIGAVEIKNATDDTRAVVKTDGVNNALVVFQNSVPVTTIKYPDENTRILEADDSVMTVNYSDATKSSVSNIVSSSSTLTRKVTDTYDYTGGTTLVITRVVADV